jgi:hypothetical protein
MAVADFFAFALAFSEDLGYYEVAGVEQRAQGTYPTAESAAEYEGQRDDDGGGPESGDDGAARGHGRNR